MTGLKSTETVRTNNMSDILKEKSEIAMDAARDLIEDFKEYQELIELDNAVMCASNDDSDIGLIIVQGTHAAAIVEEMARLYISFKTGG